jgi:hypothetical protein
MHNLIEGSLFSSAALANQADARSTFHIITKILYQQLVNN